MLAPLPFTDINEVREPLCFSPPKKPRNSARRYCSRFRLVFSSVFLGYASIPALDIPSSAQGIDDFVTFFSLVFCSGWYWFKVLTASRPAFIADLLIPPFDRTFFFLFPPIERLTVRVRP